MKYDQVLYPTFGANIYVGNCEACDVVGLTKPQFDRYIHIWHTYHADDVICSAVRSVEQDLTTPREFGVKVSDRDLFVVYDDDGPLKDIWEPVWDFAHGTDDSIFLHCTAGLCRSPTLAILCMVARGIPPARAFKWACDAMWTHGQVPYTRHNNLREIFKIAQAKGVI